MGKKDTVQKDYMSEPKYFADAFNYYLFNGKQLIVADNLSEKDPTELEIRFTEENKEIIQKVRDVLKQCVIKEDDKYDKLAKLKKLLDDNVITQEEFENEKSKLLH